MAVPERIRPEGDFPQPGEPGYPSGQAYQPTELGAQWPLTEVKKTAARLLGMGYQKNQVADILVEHLVDVAKWPDRRVALQKARNKLRRWQEVPAFRDLVYEHAIKELDGEVPSILKGVSYKARRGRVDAARLALEVTGRHNPRGGDATANVTIQIANIPRPPQAGG